MRLTRSKMTALLGTSLIVALAGQAIGDTIVGDFTWSAGSTQPVAETLRVQGTLTVEQGVMIDVAPGVQIIIENGGVLNVAGTNNAPVVFSPTSGRWNGLSFEQGSAGTISHAVLETMAAVGVRIDNASPEFDSVVVQDVTGAAPSDHAYGFIITGAASPVIDRSLIQLIVGRTGGSTSNQARGTEGDEGANGNSGHRNGYAGSVGGNASSASDAGDGGEAVGIHLDNGAIATITSTTIASIRGGHGGNGGNGGEGGRGGDAGDGARTLFETGNGGRGGNAGAAGHGGDGGDAGDAIAIRSLNPAARVVVAQNLIYDLRGGWGGDAGAGGKGGNGGYGGWGASTNDLFTPGGNGGDGGTGTHPGAAGKAGDAGEALAFVVRNAATRAQFAQNTVAKLIKGVEGDTDLNGACGPGGAPGGPGTGGPGAGDGVSGDEGTWVCGTNFSNRPGPAGLIGNTVALRAEYQGATPFTQIEVTNSVFSIGDNGYAVLFRTADQARIGTDFNLVADYTTLSDGPAASTSVGFGTIFADPMFADHASDDFRLLPGSPAIDAGDSDEAHDLDLVTDIDGNSRFVDDPDSLDTGDGDAPMVDVGAFEFQVTVECPGDLAAPFGELDIFDIIEYLARFDAGDASADLAAPFGEFDIFDIIEYLARFDAGCP